MNFFIIILSSSVQENWRLSERYFLRWRKLNLVFPLYTQFSIAYITSRKRNNRWKWKIYSWSWRSYILLEKPKKIVCSTVILKMPEPSTLLWFFSSNRTWINALHFPWNCTHRLRASLFHLRCILARTARYVLGLEDQLCASILKFVVCICMPLLITCFLWFLLIY